MYLFNHLVILELIHAYLFYALSMNPKPCYLFCCSYCSNLGCYKFFQVGSYVPWTCLPSFVLFCEHFHTCWHYKMLQTYFDFPCFSPRISHFFKELQFFCWEWYLEIKIWVLGVLVASGVPLLIGPSNRWY